MLGGGNPVSGNNPTGTGSSINYVGNHAYANSGAITVENSADAGTTLLKFSLGNSYIMADIHIFNNQASALDDFIHVKIDGQLIVKARYQNANELHQDQPLKVLIPPFSQFEIKASTSGATPEFTAVLTGRVY
jgi:hypothetical protein